MGTLIIIFSAGKRARSTEATAVTQGTAWAAPPKAAYMPDPELAEAGTGASVYGMPLKKSNYGILSG